MSVLKQTLFRKRVVLVICAGSLALQIGCYSYLPVQATPPQLLERVSLTVNDKGRVLLGDRMGPSISHIEGRLLRTDSLNVVLGVSRVTDINGVASNWLGEEVSIPREAILAYQDRPLSRSRTFFLAAAIVGGLIALALSISLAVSGGDGPPDTLDKGSNPSGPS